MSDRILSILALVIAAASLLFALSLQGRVDSLSVQLDKAVEGPAADSQGDEEPGFELADAMRALALRMSNLWFARNVGSLALFDYEVHEINEVQAELAAASLTEAGRDVDAEVDRLIIQKLSSLRTALESGDIDAYEKAYRRVLAGCNDCHEATAHPFIRIEVPVGPQLGNRRIGP